MFDKFHVSMTIATRLRVPSLVLFLGVGMLVGSDGLGWIAFDNYRLARTIGVISLALILFEGGLTSGLLHLRRVLGAAASLATVGTAITAVIVGMSAAVLFGFSTKEGLLLGAIEDAKYARGSIQLNSGDMLLVYSDGIIESRNKSGEEFSYARLKTQLRNAQTESADAVLFSVLGAVQDFAATRPLEDDMSLVVVRRAAQP